MQDRLFEMRAYRDGLWQSHDQWRSRTERILMDQREFRQWVSELNCTRFRARKTAQPAYSHSLS